MKRFLGVFFALMLVFSLAPYGTVHAASFTVININDSGPGSLRQAILDANASLGTDTIGFNIPGAGPHTIQPLSALSTITEPVTIDGYTQLGASPNTNPPGLGLNTMLMIELDGSDAGSGANGFHITAGNTTVRGLVINRFDSNGVILKTNGNNVIEGNFIGTDVTGTLALGNGSHGVFAWSDDNTIGGTRAAARNIVGGNDSIGVYIAGMGNLVQGNFIGTDVTGTSALGNARGVLCEFFASKNVVGGTTLAARNIISGNGWCGVCIAGTGNLVQGNFIGTDVTGTSALGNGSTGHTHNGGVQIRSSNNTVGGTTVSVRNIISGNTGDGVLILRKEATGNLVQGNFIGTDVTGTANLGNSRNGVRIDDPWYHEPPNDNTIGGMASGSGNTIAFNGGDGVLVVEPGNGNAILSNSIFSNAGLGIDLGADGMTLNDPGDTDSGANNLQNFPVLTSATSGSTTIEGTLNSTPTTKFRLEFFANTECDPSGYGEGETFLGFTNVTTDDSGNVSFTVTFAETVPAGHSITATTTAPDSNTSEFSQCVQVIALEPDIRTPIDPIDFGDVEVSSSLDETTTLYNDGTATLTINTVTRLSGSAEFTYVGPTTPFDIEPRLSQAITIRFAPTSAGLKSATFNINSNDPDEGLVEVALSGSAMQIALPTVDFNPDTLNLKSRGKVVTVYIELPEGYDVEETDISTVMLNGIVPALAHPTDVGDYDSDGVSDLMVKFDRSDVQDVLEPGNEVEVTVSGQLTDGTTFEGTDTIRVIEKEKK